MIRALHCVNTCASETAHSYQLLIPSRTCFPNVESPHGRVHFNWEYQGFLTRILSSSLRRFCARVLSGSPAPSARAVWHSRSTPRPFCSSMSHHTSDSLKAMRLALFLRPGFDDFCISRLWWKLKPTCQPSLNDAVRPSSLNVVAKSRVSIIARAAGSAQAVLKRMRKRMRT